MEKKKFLRNYCFSCLVIFLSVAGDTYAGSASEIDIKVSAAIKRFADEVDSGQAFLNAAKGLLVFPNVVKAGFGIGGEYGEGAMLIGGKTVDYYNTAAASIGFQIGAQTKTIILVFLEDEAVKKFRASDGWEVGVDGAVALIQIGTGGSIDTSNVTDPIVGFVLNNKGLMYNLTLEGSKMSKIKK